MTTWSRLFVTETRDEDILPTERRYLYYLLPAARNLPTRSFPSSHVHVSEAEKTLLEMVHLSFYVPYPEHSGFLPSL